MAIRQKRVAIFVVVWYDDFIEDEKEGYKIEFNEKLQELRKQKGLTQEELAEKLYVSRKAVSKWESGRGYPNIDSLKEIAKYFSITVDELLSGNELLKIAEEDGKQKKNTVRDLVFGLIDCSIGMFLFLPFFGQRSIDAVTGVSLLSLNEVSPWLKYLYVFSVIATVIYGILTLALQNLNKPFWIKNKSKLSLFITALGTLLFIVSMQPYAAAYLFVMVLIKALILVKWR